ncbi:MAG: RNA polymerase sigma factor [Thiomonas sp.]
MDDCSLLTACAQGDTSALERLHARHARAAYAFARRMCGRAQDADDAVAEAFITLWQQAARFDRRSSVRTWLLGIVRHKVLDQLRRRDQAPAAADDDEVLPPEPSDPGADPFEQLARQQQVEQLQTCLDALPLPQREALYLALVEGLTLREIAAIQQVPDNTVATRIHHAKRKLRDCLMSANGLKNPGARRDSAA